MAIIIIGEHAKTNPLHFLTWQADEFIQIGKFSALAIGVKILGGGEHFSNVNSYPLKAHFLTDFHKDVVSKGPTIIGNDVKITTDAIVLSGVKIGDGAVVGAGAVVTRDVPPYAIVGGSPAKIIKYKFTEEQIKALLRIRWWDWSFEEIKEFEEYFYGDVDVFIVKAFEKMEKEGRL